jgi:hypothetical protein
MKLLQVAMDIQIATHKEEYEGMIVYQELDDISYGYYHAPNKSCWTVPPEMLVSLLDEFNGRDLASQALADRVKKQNYTLEKSGETIADLNDRLVEAQKPTIADPKTLIELIREDVPVDNIIHLKDRGVI